MRVAARLLPTADVNSTTTNNAGHPFVTRNVQARGRGRTHRVSMNSTAIAVYVASVLVLLAKFMVAITVQAVQRKRAGVYRYAEDAAFWQGRVAADTDLCVRAQRLLRNDSESQPYYLVLGAAYLGLGAWPAAAPYYFAAYALSRVVHAYCLFAARQPQRNRAFAFGAVVLALLAVHVAFESVRLIAS